MKIARLRLLACLGLLLVGASAQAYQPGAWVLAKYRNGAYWYPGVVKRDSNGQIAVTYDDGDRETLVSALVKNYDWQVGSRVECNWRGRGTWYPGRITALRGGTLSMAYDDGDRENTATGRCRSK